LAAAPQKESNIKFTYRHWIRSRRLLPAPQQCGCFSHVDSFVIHISEETSRVDHRRIFTTVPDRGDNTLWKL